MEVFFHPKNSLNCVNQLYLFIHLFIKEGCFVFSFLFPGTEDSSGCDSEKF